MILITNVLVLAALLIKHGIVFSLHCFDLFGREWAGRHDGLLASKATTQSEQAQRDNRKTFSMHVSYK